MRNGITRKKTNYENTESNKNDWPFVEHFIQLVYLRCEQSMQSNARFDDDVRTGKRNNMTQVNNVNKWKIRWKAKNCPKQQPTRTYEFAVKTKTLINLKCIHSNCFMHLVLYFFIDYNIMFY